MDPTNMKCIVCDKPFHNKQNRLSCENYFQPGCVNVKGEEIDFWIVNSNSKFECSMRIHEVKGDIPVVDKGLSSTSVYLINHKLPPR